jgi:ribonuclease P protein component
MHPVNAGDRPGDHAATDAPAGGFPRTARLLKPSDFKGCFESGERLSGRLFRLHLTCAPDAAARLGLAVSRKVSPHAVVRNRIKRVARASFRDARARLPAVDVVLLAKREAASASTAELHAELTTLWRRLATLKRSPRKGTMRADSAPAVSAGASPISASAAAAPADGASGPDSA